MVIKSTTYKLLYDKFFHLFAKKEHKKDFEIDRPRLWKLKAFEKRFFEDGHLMEWRVQEVTNGYVQDRLYYYKKYLEATKETTVDVRSPALVQALIYIGIKFPSGTNIDDLNPRQKAEALVSKFEKDFEKVLGNSLESNRLISPQLRPIIRHLIEGNWWFCFRGHPVQSKPRPGDWLLVYNQMIFEEDGRDIKVSKLKKNQREAFKNTYGTIDLRASNDRTLAINLVSDGLKEHCHIKLNIDLSLQEGKDLFLGEFLQHEDNGYISSGSAMLISAEGSEIKYEAGHFGGLAELADGQESFDFEPPQNMPYPFRDIAFYFADKKQNMRRTTNHSIFNTADLLNWKKNKFKSIDRHQHLEKKLDPPIYDADSSIKGARE